MLGKKVLYKCNWAHGYESGSINHYIWSAIQVKNHLVNANKTIELVKKQAKEDLDNAHMMIDLLLNAQHQSIIISQKKEIGRLKEKIFIVLLKLYHIVFIAF